MCVCVYTLFISGVNRYLRDLEVMLGSPPPKALRYIWTGLIPLIAVVSGIILLLWVGSNIEVEIWTQYLLTGWRLRVNTVSSLKGIAGEDAHRPDNVDNLQPFPFVDFVWLLYRYLCNRSFYFIYFFFAWNWSSLGRSHIGSLFTTEDRKGLARECT